MHRTDSAGSTADHLFTNGDPAHDINPTEVDAAWLNDVQENIAQLIEAAGIALIKGDYTQLRAAVVKLIVSAVAGHNESGTAHADIRALLEGISIPTASETVAGVIKQATNAQALAGADNTTAMSPADVAAAISGVVRSYTLQQYPAQVARTGQSGAQAVDLDQHQALAITATGPITMSAPTKMAAEKWCTLRFFSATPQTISWDASWHATSIAALPTVTVAGKWLTVTFVCLGAYMVMMGMVQEA